MSKQIMEIKNNNKEETQKENEINKKQNEETLNAIIALQRRCY